MCVLYVVGERGESGEFFFVWVREGGGEGEGMREGERGLQRNNQDQRCPKQHLGKSGGIRHISVVLHLWGLLRRRRGIHMDASRLLLRTETSGVFGPFCFVGGWMEWRIVGCLRKGKGGRRLKMRWIGERVKRCNFQKFFFKTFEMQGFLTKKK